ncbi:HutD/Ves family protein [Thalassotalea sediminis]|uniref:HutD/Ves family protein n=1 Tax=Thalassotalea sediminis TaxID=1759089 RepID=UPI002572224E|nr:HutD family protein [Thalassotalea sediminis]
MIKVIPQKDFVRKPWKNGLGETCELAINDGGTVNHFDWRLSLATISESGEFSTFPETRRDLFLVAGKGMYLKHRLAGVQRHDTLVNLFDGAVFDGNSQTVSTLIDGPVQALNLMTRKNEYNVECHYYKGGSTVSIAHTEYSKDEAFFIYAATNEKQEMLTMTTVCKHQVDFQRGDLLLLTDRQPMTVKGSNFIVIVLTKV